TIRTEVDDLAKILVAGLVLGVNDGNDTDLPDKGDGIQRQILFRVFQLYADFRAQRGVFKPDEGAPPVDRGPNIIAFEEPELFLHPQAQEQFFDDLVTVSAGDQVLLSTHSSFLVRLERAGGLHIVRRSTQNAPTEFKTADLAWVDADERQRLKEINLCSGDVSKVFFADRVVITEGQEDVIYIVGTARDHADCLDRRVTVVEVGGKQRIPSLQKVLNAFGIPYTVACDLDPGNADTAKNNARILELVEKANQEHGPIATVEHFDPDIPEVCHGCPPPPGEKPFNALLLIRDGKPTDAFAARVKSLFRI
ncbi:MAG: AAA family ATPase, partial [Planctomycetes bacterium]|nr:AAA family ATPase [Planctomycetota bacterium]